MVVPLEQGQVVKAVHQLVSHDACICSCAPKSDVASMQLVLTTDVLIVSVHCCTFLHLQVTGMLGGGAGGGGAHIDLFINQGFGFFDKDKSGFVEGPEVKACVEKVLSLAGITSIPTSAIDGQFNKVAGPDQKLDKAEFTALIHQLLQQQGQQPAAPGAAPPAAAAPKPA